MEWTWLKDWWRLKKYRSQHRNCKLNHHGNNNDVGDHQHCNHHHHQQRHHHHQQQQQQNADEQQIENDESANDNEIINVNENENEKGIINDSNNDNANDNSNEIENNDNESANKVIKPITRRQSRSRRKSRSQPQNSMENNDSVEVNGDTTKCLNQRKLSKKHSITDFYIKSVDNDNDNYNNDNYAEEDDDEVNDFCYCDECLNGDTDFCESNDGMDSDASTSSNQGKQVLVGICAMAKKTQSKPMKEILTRLQEFEFIKMVIFEEDVILKEPVENWPVCDCLVSFHSKGFPLEKAIQYAQLRKPYVLNNLHMQYDIQDRRKVYSILEKEGIEIPRYAVLDRDSPDPKHHELIESEDHVEVNGIIFNKPFVEKPVSAEDHNIYIYYPTSAGGGSQRLFRKIGSRSSVYSPESRVRKTGSFIYEDFMPTDGTDVKVYTVGPDYAHAEARKSPALDGKVERDSEGKEIRYPVILNHAEKLISRKVCMAFKQTVCGFDLLRANGKSFVCDVNGFSFVKNSNKYYDDCAKILGNMILRELTPTLHIPWSVPFQLDDPPIVPTTFGKMMELRCVVAVIRHGDRTPKQKMKVEVRHPKFFEVFEKYDGYKCGHVKLKRPKQLQEILDIARFLLAEIETKDNPEIEEKKSKLEQLKSVLEMYGHFSGINRKVQMKYQPKGRPRGSSSDDGNNVKNLDAPADPSLVLILKWGGELTPAGRIQAEELGRIFRCMYPGGQGRQDYSGTQGLGLLRLHSTFRHDLKIYASDEGRVQMTAAAFAKGLLALEGELTPILVQMVKSANTNGLLDNDCDSSKYQNMAKSRLHELMQTDRDFTADDRLAINPNNSISINQALDFVKNPVECCHHVHKLIKDLLVVISVKKDDPKTKDAILYHGETWDLMRCRWEKIEKDFSTKSKLYDISKIPDIYDCIKYDLQHNQHTLQYDQAEELYIYAKYLADIVIPQEYGLTMQEKLTIGQGICTPLLKKIKSDLQRNIEEVDDESVNRLNPQYSRGVASPGRHVRTRLYFTSESHVHSLLTVLRYGGLLNVLTDEQWRRAMDYISMVSELNYMSQIVIMLYEDPTKDPTSEERFHVELHFSPGVNCCVQKNLPPGPGFRPHSRNDSGQLKNLSNDDSLTSNPSRIDEENDLDDSPIKGKSPPDVEAEMMRHFKSKPIPIGSHHTVCGHEAMDLAKRLNEELASQQQGKQMGSLETPRPVSPDAEPRSRSYEQRHTQKSKEDYFITASLPTPIPIPPPTSTTSSIRPNRDFDEILTSRATNQSTSAFQIRVTDNLTFFKIDSSTNELPLSEIDFSLNPGTPEKHLTSACTAHKANSASEQLHKKQAQLLTMRRMESADEPDYVQKLRDIRRMSPMATNERPLTCNCNGGHSEDIYPHAHSKSEADLSDMLAYHRKDSASPSLPSSPEHGHSFDEEFQLSSSAPASLLSGEFLASYKSKNVDLLKPSSASTSPTASTLRLCQALDKSKLSDNQHQDRIDKQLVRQSSANRTKTNRTLASAQSAPVIVEPKNPFKFPDCYSFKSFAPIAENVATNINVSSSPIIITTSASMIMTPTMQPVLPTTPLAMTTTITTPQHQNNNYHMHHHHHHQQQQQHHHHHHYQPQQHYSHHHPQQLHYNPHYYQHYYNQHHANGSSPNAYHIHATTTTPLSVIPNVVVTITSSSNQSSLNNLTNILLSPYDSNSEFNIAPNPNPAATISSINPYSTITTPLLLNDPNMAQNQSCNPFNDPPYNNISNINAISSCNSFSSSFLPLTMNHMPPPPITTATTTTTNIDGTATSVSSSSSVSSRRQRHSIAGQMSYMKMLGFGGFSKKMTTSANSLFSTAVISGSSSAPNLRDMIPVSSSVLEGFGGVPPIRPLETLHNALSLKQLDLFLEKMTSAPLFKTPTCTPPKNPSTPLSMITTTLEEETCTASTPTNNVCHCSNTGMDKTVAASAVGSEPEICKICGNPIQQNVPTSNSSSFILTAPMQQQQTQTTPLRTFATDSSTPVMTVCPESFWSKQSSIASSITEPSSPAISDTYSQETPSCEMSISLASTDGGGVGASFMPPGTSEKLARFFPRLDDDLNLVTVYAPMNMDSLEMETVDELSVSTTGAVGGGKSTTCLTPVSFNMDLSIVANKGSLTLSVDGFEDDDATPSAATTPSLPIDEPQLEFCYCCESHSVQGEPPDDTQKSNDLFNVLRNRRLAAHENRTQCICHEQQQQQQELQPTTTTTTQALLNPEPPMLSIRKASDPISPRIQKQISLFESGELDRQKDFAAIHASINIPQPSSLQLKQDARLRKFENLTQSTSNSNFPFESNTLKRAPNNVEDFVDANLTQSCINLKTSSAAACPSESSSSVCSSPQHKAMSVYRPVTQSFYTMPADIALASGPSSPRPGALIVKEKFIEPPQRITRSFHGKTQSMDADFLFNEILLVPCQASAITAARGVSIDGEAEDVATATAKSNKRFRTTKVIADEEEISEV